MIVEEQQRRRPRENEEWMLRMGRPRVDRLFMSTLLVAMFGHGIGSTTNYHSRCCYYHTYHHRPVAKKAEAEA